MVFDGLHRSVFTEGARTRTGRKLLRFAAARGEPLISAFDPGEWDGLLGDGFEVAHMLEAEAMRRRWFEGRSDGIEPWTYAYLVHARRARSNKGLNLTG
jgi:O-methyltransferase involved in polyketide biosynthesis